MSPNVFDDESTATVVVVADDMVIDSAEAAEKLAELIHAGRSRIVLDMRQAAHLSGIGLGCIADAAKAARQAGGDVKLVVHRPEVRRLFELAELGTLFEFYGDVESASQGFSECVGEVERTLLWRQFNDA